MKPLTHPPQGLSNRLVPNSWLLMASVSSWLVTAGSAVVCILASWLRLPGMVLAGVTPDWPLIWVVCWSVNRPLWQGSLGGAVMGFLYDSISHNQPTHALGLAIVGGVTSLLNKRRSVKEEFITVALLVFGMVIVAETVLAVQHSFVLGWDEVSGRWVRQSLQTIWTNYCNVVFISAVLTSLWAPAVYLPMNVWWRYAERWRAQ